jgi:predicted helicase
MPTLADLLMPPPRSWDEFEAIVCSTAKNRWKNPEFTRHGRQGQRQDGVDIFGQDDKGRLVGLQCKNTLGGFTAATISAEVKKAESFKSALQQLFVVTTADTDKHLQEFVRDLSEQRSKAGTFEVAVLFWPDV